MTILFPDGKRIAPRTAYAGKVMVVCLISTTCAHCEITIRILSSAQKEFGSRGFQAIGAAFNDDAKTLVGDYVKRYQPAFPVGYMEREEGIKIAAIPEGVRPFVPILMFIDGKGVVRYQFYGDHPFFKDEQKGTRAIVSTLLRQVAPAQAAQGKK